MEDSVDMDNSVLKPILETELYEVKLEFLDGDEKTLPRVCYALAHNRVPIVKSLKVTSTSNVPVERLTLRFSGEWAVNERSPIKESQLVIDSPEFGKPLEIAPVTSVLLSDIALAELEEMAPATLVVELIDNRGNSQVIRTDFEVYPRDQWLSSLKFGVLTAAFVQPNHPDVGKVLEKASKILQRRGTPGLSGYQDQAGGQPHRIAQAIFEALQEFVDTYINPPASFNEVGQQVRPIDRVLQERQGTCIDLACAYASCLEQAGLHPVIYLVKGHAFTGYMTEEVHFQSSLVLTWPAIQGYLDSGLIVGVETVGIPQRFSFEEAKAAVQEHENDESMHALIDVLLAHREGLRPIPARVIRDNVLVVVIDNGPAAPALVEKRDAKTRKLLVDEVPPRIQGWKNSLLDLTFRNRLLNLKLERQGIGVLAPLGKLGWIEDHLNEGGSLVLKAGDVLDAVQAARVQRASQLERDELEGILLRANGLHAYTDSGRFKTSVSRLVSDSRTQEEESGANCLYLTLGSVKWSGKYGDYLSPIFLVPIRLKNIRGASAVQIEMDSTQATTVNFCLIEALRNREQMVLQWFSDDMSDDLGLDVEAGFESLRREFREKGLDVQGFGVEQNSGIAVLDFKKYRLWRDLNDHWKEFMATPLVKHLVESPRETFVDAAQSSTAELKFDDTSTVCPQPADGSQIAAIEKALAGQTFVLEGPPGSGKSQTITNLLANAMLRGKKVLFVAEKQAALQEVQERLEAVNLDPFCLILHDSGTHPEDLRAQLRVALEQNPLIDERLNQQFEDEFANAAAQLDDYRSKVYSKNEVGFSFASAFRRLGELGEGPVVEVPREFLKLDQDLGAQLIKQSLELEELTRVAQARVGHPWGFAGSISFTDVDRARLASSIDAVLQLSQTLAEIDQEDLARALASAVSQQMLLSVADVLDIREAGVRISPKDLAIVAEDAWIAEIRQLVSDGQQALLELPSKFLGHEKVLRDADISRLVAAVVTASESFPLGRKKRVEQALGTLGQMLDVERDGVDGVVRDAKELLRIAEHLRSLWTELGLKPVTSLLIPAEMPVTSQELADRSQMCEVTHRAGVALSNPAISHDTLRSLFSHPGMLAVGLAGRIREFIAALNELFEILNADESTIEFWATPNGLVTAAHSQSRETWKSDVNSGSYLSLQRWLSLKAHLKQFSEVGLSKMCRDIESGALEARLSTAALERGILHTTLAVRAEETNLDVFDSNTQTRRVLRFIELLTQRQKNAEAVIPFQLHRSRRFSAGVDTGKVGDFRTEINSTSKKRRGRSIRTLIEKYPEIVSDLTPCFLMSPDSVAQFLPPGSINFDVVVFDEASQIETADAVGTLGRASSSVIVGDSKQMPPSRFGVLGIDEDDPSTGVDEGENSILEEALAAGVKRIWLKWHYRSQDESLIAFSNDHYYERRLLTFPAPVDFQSDCGVFYRRVDGQFDHGKTRTNEIEARAIVEELIKRLDDPLTADLTYGIVTLNIQQRDLLTSIVDANPHPRIRELRETDDKKRRIFILNLENVQGRERDVIIFGTSFSKRADGGAMPLSFGPLTLTGGQKRLNVAVTRAKRQFVVVSSFDPEELSSATSEGMVHLREYLFSARQRARRELVTALPDQKVVPQIVEIARRLEDRGVIVGVNRGLSEFKLDLVLSLPSHSEQWLVAVLFDSERWSEKLLAIDRDALPMIVLEKVMRWPRVARVWMPSVRIDISDVVDDLAEQVFLAAQAEVGGGQIQPLAVEAVGAEESSATPEDPVGRSVALDPAVVEAQVDRPSLLNEGPFVIHVSSGVPKDAGLLQSRIAQNVLESIVDTEGPMAVSQALKRVANAFGLQRVRENRLADMGVLLGTRQVTEIAGIQYLWPAGTDPDSWRMVRRSTSEQRNVPDISPYEIVNAMEEVIQRSLSISTTELNRWIANYFGVNKVGAAIAEHLQMCIDWGVASGRFVLKIDQLSIA